MGNGSENTHVGGSAALKAELQQKEELNFKPIGKTNKRLVKEAVRGNPEAVNKVIGLYYKDILYFAAKKVGLQEAEDVAQQAIGKIVNRLETLKDPTKAKSWMMKIVRDSCVDHMRRNKLENRLFASMDVIEDSGFEVEENTDEFLPEEALENAEMRAQIIESIDTLPENYADVLRLYYFDDLDYDEIAEVLDISRRKVKNDLYNARNSFKKKFEAGTGVQTRFAAATPLATAPVLTQVLTADCDQLITPDMLERTATFASTAIGSKFGATALSAGPSGKASAGTSGATVGKVVAIAVCCVVAVGITVGFMTEGFKGSAEPAPEVAPIEAPAEEQPDDPEAGVTSIETLADMIGEEKAVELETYVSVGVDEATWQAFLHDIGAELHANAYEPYYSYAVYVREEQDRQLVIEERKSTDSPNVEVLYQFGPIADVPRMAKVALMFP